MDEFDQFADMMRRAKQESESHAHVGLCVTREAVDITTLGKDPDEDMAQAAGLSFQDYGDMLQSVGTVVQLAANGILSHDAEQVDFLLDIFTEFKQAITDGKLTDGIDRKISRQSMPFKDYRDQVEPIVRRWLGISIAQCGGASLPDNVDGETSEPEVEDSEVPSLFDELFKRLGVRKD